MKVQSVPLEQKFTPIQVIITFESKAEMLAVKKALERYIDSAAYEGYRDTLKVLLPHVTPL
jgi:hypothetical protein